MRTQIAVLTPGDERRAFFESKAALVESERGKVRACLERRYDLFMPEPVFSHREALARVDEARRMGIACVIIHLPVWGSPNLAATLAKAADGPVLLLGNRMKQSSSLVCMLAVAGMLDQAGQKAVRVLGAPDEDEIVRELTAFADACAVLRRLSRCRVGAIGGRSIGIGTGVADPAQWMSLFGCEIDHCDQHEVIRRAERIPGAQVARHRDWLTGAVRGIEFGGLFTEGALDRQIRSYLALRALARDKEYDALALKCQTEMSDHFALQCLGVSLLNNDFDADGVKKPLPCACECDMDGALTMLLLSLCADGAPVCLADIKHIDGDARELVLANCGSLPLGFSHEAYLVPHMFGAAGGASVQMVARAGAVTLARLFRSHGQYRLACFEGEAFAVPRERLRETTYCYPHQFVRADIDFTRLFQTINSNHMHTVYGRHADTLRRVCEMLPVEGIRYE